MKTKNLTPFLYGYKVTSRNPPQVEMTVIVRASFVLKPGQPLVPIEGTDQGPLTAEMYRDDDDERAGLCLYPGDFADFKPHADLLLKATCHAPGDDPVPGCPVKFSVGDWSKELLVIGPRSWNHGLLGDKMMEPEPFSEMPLTWENAFGGPAFELNPCGKGHGDSLELPTVEDPAHLIHAHIQKPAPAGFGPINPAWEPRAHKVGKKYGARWKKHRSPWFSEDFDWTHFNAAPADQQLSHYLKGDEPFIFENMHADVAEFTGRLPGLRIRTFFKTVDAAFHEVAMHLDTFHADIDSEVLTLTWRGLGAIETDDMTDVATMLIASEELESEPRPAEAYRERLEVFEQNPLADQVPDELKEAAEAAEAAEAEADGDTADNPLAPMLDTLFQGMAPDIKKVATQSVSGLIAKADAAGVDFRSHIAKALAKAPSGQGAGAAALVGAPLPVNVGESLARLKAVADEAAKLMQTRGEDTSGIEKFYKALENPALKKLGYRPPPEEGLSEDEPGPGANLSGRDFARADLQGVDLSGATLDGTDFTEANLAGANLSDASMDGTLLYKANLTGAKLSGARITTANLAEIVAAETDLTDARIEQTSLDQADLARAVLDGVQARQCLVMKANLSGASLKASSFEETEFSESLFEQTDFTDASFVRCRFGEVKITGGNLSAVRLTRTSFAGSELRDTSFTRLDGNESIWDGAILDGSDFTLASLRDSHFTEVSGEGVRFHGADLRGARLFKAVIERSEFHEANLMSADVSKAKLSRISFRNANLYDAKFYKATIDECSFLGANLKMALLEQP